MNDGIGQRGDETVKSDESDRNDKSDESGEWRGNRNTKKCSI